MLWCMQAVELLREVARVEPAEYERMHDSGGVRNVANFLVELADRSEFLQHCSSPTCSGPLDAVDRLKSTEPSLFLLSGSGSS